MALRCILVGLVACLGLEVPTPSDLSSWAESGRTWVAARADEVATLRTVATGWLTAPGQPGSPAPTPAPASTPVITPSAVAESGPVGAPVRCEVGSDPGIDESGDQPFEAITATMAHGFAAEGRLLAAEEAPPAPEVDEVVVSGEVGSRPNRLLLVERRSGPTPEVAQPEPEGNSTAGRLQSAVRLTHEAIRAWVTVVGAVGSDETVVR